MHLVTGVLGLVSFAIGAVIVFAFPDDVSIYVSIYIGAGLMIVGMALDIVSIGFGIMACCRQHGFLQAATLDNNPGHSFVELPKDQEGRPKEDV